MKEEDIRNYAQLMKDMDLSGLEIDEKNQTVRLERNVQDVVNVVQTSQSLGSSNMPEVASASTADTPVETSDSPKDYISITSPMVGTFYRAPEVSADPYVKTGDHVEKGATLCIIEAMKLMNEIPSEESGEIIEICAQDGQMVEYGTELFRIKK